MISGRSIDVERHPFPNTRSPRFSESPVSVMLNKMIRTIAKDMIFNFKVDVIFLAESQILKLIHLYG